MVHQQPFSHFIFTVRKLYTCRPMTNTNRHDESKKKRWDCLLLLFKLIPVYYHFSLYNYPWLLVRLTYEWSSFRKIIVRILLEQFEMHLISLVFLRNESDFNPNSYLIWSLFRFYIQIDGIWLRTNKNTRFVLSSRWYL